jgi:hypothetical protein
MSELTHLQFQQIDPSSDDGVGDDDQDDINLDEQVTEDELDHYWDEVVEDIHKDPDWFTFADE